MTNNEMRALGDLFQALASELDGEISPEIQAKYEEQRDMALKVLSQRPKRIACSACDTESKHNLVNGFWVCELCGYRLNPAEVE